MAAHRFNTATGHTIRCGVLLAWGILTCGLIRPLAAQYPTAQLNSVYPFGGKAGTTVEVVIAGTDLDEVNELICSHPGIAIVPKLVPAVAGKPPQPVANAFTVTIAADVPRGQYEARARGYFGLSNPRAFAVNTLSEITEIEPNDNREKAQEFPLNTIINGRIEAEKSDYFSVQLTAGQRILVECLAYRADSQLDGTLVVFNAQGNELARANDSLRRDPLLDFTAAADGKYFIQLYDFLYRGGDTHAYRLTLSTAPRIDFIFPPSGQPGSKGKYALYGRNLAGGTKCDVKSLDGAILDKLEVEIELPAASTPSAATQATMLEPQDAAQDCFLYSAKLANGEANAVPIYFAAAPLTVEQEPNSKPAEAQKLTVPTEVAGQFQARGDQDYFAFEAQKGETWWIEVISERMGQTTDPFMLVQRVAKNDKGEETVQDLAEFDDAKKPSDEQMQNSVFDLSHGDAVYKLVAPETGTYRVLVRDLYYQSRGNPRYLYRLVIRKPAPDFRLIAVAEPPRNQQNANQVPLWSACLHKGGTQGVRVYALRQDEFAGDIRVTVEGLPAGVTCPEINIGGGASLGTLVFSATEDAASWSGKVKIVGRAQTGERESTRTADTGTLVWGSPDRSQTALRARMAADLMLSVSGGETQPVTIEMGPGAMMETSLAGKLEIPVKINRRGEFKEPLKLQAIGMPKDIKINDMDVAADKNEAKLALEIKKDAGPGTYTFVMQAGCNLKNYRRNPQAADAAEKVKVEAEKFAKEMDEQLKTAQTAKQNADKAVQEADNLVKQTGDALNAANKTLQEAQAKLQTAVSARDAAKKAADEKTDDENLKKAAEQAAADLSIAEPAVKTETEKQQAADKVAAEAKAKKQAADTARGEADKAQAEMMNRKAAAEQAKNEADKKAKETAEAAKPKSINVVFYTMPVTVKIAPAPFTFAAEQTSVELKPGQKVELSIKVNRLFGFNDEIKISLHEAEKIGLKNVELTIPKDQSEGKLTLEVGGAPKPGNHAAALKAKINYNGQQLTVDQNVTVNVTAP